MSAATCEKCGRQWQLWGCPDKTVKCTECGAVYVITKREEESQGVRIECDFREFQCVHMTISSGCPNVCPAPGMYCKEHLSDESYAAIKNSIKYYEDMIASSKEKINKMDESKQTWLVQEIAGIEDKQ